MLGMLIHPTLEAAIQPPVVHPSIMLDAKFYGGDAANNGDYNTTNRYQVRKAALAFEGSLDENISYDIEFGTSTCSGSGVQFKLMDAGIFYHVNPNLKVGLQQGHILRGFAATTECTARMTMEKARFFTAFAACHPTGLVINNYLPLGDIAGLEAELALMNGTNSTLDGEHDYNLGTILHSPLEGLALTAVYNHTAQHYFDANYNEVSKDGYRAIGGIQYENYGIKATAEYYIGKGFSSHDQKMNAAYLEAGYAFPVAMQSLTAIQPYVLYEYWDKSADTDADSEFDFFSAGVNFSLSAATKIKMQYSLPTTTPDGLTEEPSSFVARLQIAY
jgi:hypothetical protein